MMTGIGTPFSIFWVCALNALQNSMMFKPRWPSAGPIGGDGLAAPAGTCNLRNPVTFLAITHSCKRAGVPALLVQVRGADLDGWLTASPPTSLCTALAAAGTSRRSRPPCPAARSGVDTHKIL